MSGLMSYNLKPDLDNLHKERLEGWKNFPGSGWGFALPNSRELVINWYKTNPDNIARLIKYALLTLKERDPKGYEEILENIIQQELFE